MNKLIISLLLFFSTTLLASETKNVNKLEKQLIELINKERKKKGLKPLKEYKKLTTIARKHSQNMADKKVSFGHGGFDSRFKKAKELGIKRFGENVAYSYKIKDPLEAAVKSWMKSDGHKENILDKRYSETAIGIAYDKKGTFYVTQLFATK